MERYRLSLDIGTNSIGWCALRLEERDGSVKPISVLDTGVRVFPDGRKPGEGASNAVVRRMARSARRNRDRYLERRNRLLETLIAAGLMPADERERRALTVLDPYDLRARGIEEELSLNEFGRAIFHLNQRRGFKSNRKTDARDKDSGIVKQAVNGLRPQMKDADARTFGQYLFLRRERGEAVRSRLQSRMIAAGDGKEKKEEYYDFYPSREELDNEFEVLWRVQAKHHPETLTDSLREAIHRIIFYQRPLRPPIVGKCLYERQEDRAPKAFPIVQRCRIYLELNHLQVIDLGTLKSRPLRIEERDLLARLLCEPRGKKSGGSKVTFKAMRKALRLSERTLFSHESEKREDLDADSTSALLCHKTRFGPRWYTLSDEEQEGIVHALLNESDEEKLLEWLISEWGLDRGHAEAAANTVLPGKHARLGMTATRKILVELVEEVIPYSEAVVRAGYRPHSQFFTGDAKDRLPYYGQVLERQVVVDPEKGGHPAASLEERYGKVSNPTVHIALNQVRKLVNEVIKLHGRPAQIHVEVLRDLKNSLKRRKEIEEEQKANQDRNDANAKRLREEFGLRVNRENLQRLRLLEELGAANRLCVYTGESITARNLFTEAVEIDHILPFKRTLDDGMANKILCMRHANREKTNRSPFEAWGNTERWPDILARTEVLPRNKWWRFGEDAMDRYEKEGDFIARQLTDSQYITRLVAEYLGVLYGEGEGNKVVCLPGRLTGMFRHHLGLNDILDEINRARATGGGQRGEKNRADHRNHAVDAVVVGLMDRAFLQRASATNARLEEEGVYKLLKGFGEPWPGFRDEVREALSGIVVSHKPDHGIEGALHNLTAYGFAEREDQRGQAIHRVPATDITVGKIPKIRGKRLRADLVAHLTNLSHDEAFKILQEMDDSTGSGKQRFEELCRQVSEREKDMGTKIQGFFQARGIRRVRLIECIALIPIVDRNGFVYKGFKPNKNAYLDIYQVEGSEKWVGEMVTRFDANAGQVSGKRSGNARERHVTRLFNRDMLELEQEGKRRIFYIQKMSPKQIALAEHFEANADARTRDKEDPFRFVYKGSAEALRQSKVRFLVVSPAGRLRYLSDGPDDSASG